MLGAPGAVARPTGRHRRDVITGALEHNPGALAGLFFEEACGLWRFSGSPRSAAARTDRAARSCPCCPSRRPSLAVSGRYRCKRPYPFMRNAFCGRSRPRAERPQTGQRHQPDQAPQQPSPQAPAPHEAQQPAQRRFPGHRQLAPLHRLLRAQRELFPPPTVPASATESASPVRSSATSSAQSAGATPPQANLADKIAPPRE